MPVTFQACCRHGSWGSFATPIQQAQLVLVVGDTSGKWKGIGWGRDARGKPVERMNINFVFLRTYMTLLSQVIEIMHASCTLCCSNTFLNAGGTKEHRSNNYGVGTSSWKVWLEKLNHTMEPEEEQYLKGILLFMECCHFWYWGLGPCIGALCKQHVPRVHSLGGEARKVKMKEKKLQFKIGIRLFECYL